VWTIRSSQDLGKTLGDVRKLRDLTQQQLAEMTGMRRDYLSSSSRARTRWSSDG